MQKDIEQLQEDVKKRDSTIDAQKNYIETLHKQLSKE
jgi:hypothetical protein